MNPRRGCHDGRMLGDLVTQLLPVLLTPRERPEFNVFDVMHHGTHEKQLSNVFAWLLDPSGSHRLGDVAQRIFIDEVNRALGSAPPVPYGPYSIRQEVNTSSAGTSMDIADLVLESDDTVLVVENYYVADGHGHSFQGYRDFGAKNGKRSEVVMLCTTRGSADLTDGWLAAAVVTYPTMLRSLAASPALSGEYATEHPQQRAFLQQMEDHFVKELRVNDDQLLAFVEAVCNTGEAARYGATQRDQAAISFADALRAEALERFGESVGLLRRLRSSLFNFASEHLKDQVNEALGEAALGSVFKNYRGNYEWTVAFYRADDPEQWLAQMKFGPSAWFANASDPFWTSKVPAAEADYTRLFLTHGRTIRQSNVTLAEVLRGLPGDDLRLRDELMALING